MQLAALVELVNEWGSAPRAAAREQDLAYPPLTTLAGRLGIPRSATPATHEAFASMADRLYPIFATQSLRRRVSLVDALLSESGIRPALKMGQTVTDDWRVDDPTAALLGAAAIALRTQLSQHSPARLGTCAGRRCADTYIDNSPTGRRRFCSLTCQNRARVAAFRSRKAATRAPA